MPFDLISRPLFRQYAVVIIVNLSVICAGLGIAWPSPVLVKLQNATDPVLSRPVTDNEGAWIVSIGILCATPGNLISAYLVNRLGRKYSVLLAAAPQILSVILFLFASEVWMLMLGRAIFTLGDTVKYLVVPMYASEVDSKEVRGSLGTILQISTSVGIVIMLSVGPILSYTSLNIVFLFFLVVTALPILFIPDSPYFFYVKGDTEGSLKVLTYLRGSETKEELKEYAVTSPDEKLDKVSLLRNKIFLKTLAITIAFGVGLQLVGFGAVSYYLQTVLESTKTSIRPEVASAIIGFVELLASCCTVVVIDRFGRKTILSSTLMAMAVGMVGLGTFFCLQEAGREITGFLNFLPLASLIIVVFCYSAGCGSLIYMVIAELFDGPTRAIGCAITISMATISLFLTTYFFASVTNALGPAATYWMFAGFCVIVTIFIMICIPETKAKSFAEIQMALGSKEVKKDVEVQCDDDGVKSEMEI